MYYSNPRYAKITKPGLSISGTRNIEPIIPPTVVFPSVGDTYGGGIVFYANSVSGEIGIMSVDNVATWVGQTWATAKGNVEELTDGGQTDWVLPTREQLLVIFGNEELVEDFNLPLNSAYWSSEEDNGEEGKSYGYDVMLSQVDSYSQSDSYYAIPTRRVNFYGLPLLGDMILNDDDEEQIVFNVVAATNSVDVVNITWFVGSVPVTWSEPSFILPLRTQLTTLFSSRWLVETVLQLPLDANYWSSEEVDETVAYAIDISNYPTVLIDEGIKEADNFYALAIKTINL